MVITSITFDFFKEPEREKMYSDSIIGLFLRDIFYRTDIHIIVAWRLVWNFGIWIKQRYHLLPEKKNWWLLKTGIFFFSGKSGKFSARCKPISIYRLAPCTRLMNLNIKDLYFSRKGFRFVPEQLGRKTRSKEGHNWTEIRYEIGTVIYWKFRKQLIIK